MSVQHGSPAVQLRLCAHPEVAVQPDTWQLTHNEQPVPAPGQVLAQVKMLPVDTGMRGWITAKRSYMPAVMPGEMVSAASGAVGSIAAQSASMQGFTMHHFTDRAPEAFMALLGWKMKGQLKFREHVLRGIESFLAACDMIFSGANQGKLLIDLEGMPS